MASSPVIFRVVMLTGHRSFTPPEARWLKRELELTVRRLKEFHGLEEIVSGMALGADTLWAEAAVKAEVPFAAYIPFEAQADAWPDTQKAIWRELRAQASREVVIGAHYSVGYLHARNDAMIEDSDLCVAALKASQASGGTFSAVKKIRKLSKPMLMIDPEEKTITRERFPA